MKRKKAPPFYIGVPSAGFYIFLFLSLLILSKLFAADPHVNAGPAKGETGVKWIKVPGGGFLMGSDTGYYDAKPAHNVRVRTFLMAETEVTFGQYKACVAAGACSMPEGNTGQGICDMIGNVWEWCEDAYFNSYEGAAADGKAREPLTRFGRVKRGSSWRNREPWVMTATDRGRLLPEESDALTGFRPVKELP